MTTLDDLLHSLANIIVCYHDIKTYTHPFNAKGFDLIPDGLKKRSIALLTEENYSEQLEYLISSSTCHFPDRTQLLTYILNEMNLLKNIKDQHPGVAELSKHVTRLLTNLKCLIATSQEEQCNISVAQNLEITKYTLPGLKRTPSLLGSLLFIVVDANPASGSASFALIRKVLGTFSITESSSELRIKNIANNIVINYISSMKKTVDEKTTKDDTLDQKEPEISIPTKQPIKDDLLIITEESQPTCYFEKKSISSLLAFGIHGGHPLLRHIMEQHLDTSTNEKTLQVRIGTI